MVAVDQNFQNSVIPGSYVTLDENMVKSFHQNLKGKIKIIREPCPVGNEMKNMANSASEIVLNLELYEGSDTMSQKDYVKSHGATAATTLQITESYHGSGCHVIANNWFGSVKTAVSYQNVDFTVLCWLKLPRATFHICY